MDITKFDKNFAAGFGIVSVGGIFGENAEETDRLCFLAKKKR